MAQNDSGPLTCKGIDLETREALRTRIPIPQHAAIIGMAFLPENRKRAILHMILWLAEKANLGVSMVINDHGAWARETRDSVGEAGR